MITKNVLQTIRKNGMISAGDTVIVGLSGGIDSTALLVILSSLSKELEIKLIAAHLNHKIRGKESDSDEKFALEISKKLGIRFISESFDVVGFAKMKKLNLEDAARRIRYAFFERSAAKYGAKKIAVAHTADDNIETFLMRLIRGAGLKGLESIPPVRGNIIRPLIESSRSELEAFLKGRHIKACLDRSNLDTKYLRNRVRHELIPTLKTYNCNIKEGLLRTIKAVGDGNRLIEELTDKTFRSFCRTGSDGSVTIGTKALNSLKPAIRAGVVMSAIEKIKKDLTDVTFLNIEDVLKLAGKRKGIIDITGASVRVKNGRMTFSSSRHGGKETGKFLYKLEVPGETEIPEAGVSISSDIVDIADTGNVKKKDPYRALLDYAKISGRLIVRNRRIGDIFTPLGLKGRKKLQDIFVDEKIDEDERDTVPVIEDGNKIVWIAGYRVSEKVKIDRGTRTVVELNARKL